MREHYQTHKQIYRIINKNQNDRRVYGVKQSAEATARRRAIEAHAEKRLLSDDMTM